MLNMNSYHAWTFLFFHVMCNIRSISMLSTVQKKLFTSYGDFNSQENASSATLAYNGTNNWLCNFEEKTSFGNIF
jgi:hypothetical protein